MKMCKFMSMVVPAMAGFMLCALPLVAVAQPGGGGGGRFAAGGFGDFGANPMMLLQSEQVREALEIVDDQLAELEAVGQEMRDEMRSTFQELRNASPEERTQIMQESMEKYQARIDDILLPHQQKRLNQIVVQQRSRGRDGVAGALINENLSKELNITEDQKEKIREVGEAARAKMEEKMAQLRKEMEEEILSVLDSTQREKYKEMVGEPFELDMRQMFDRGGRRGGDRGGNRDRGNDF